MRRRRRLQWRTWMVTSSRIGTWRLNFMDHHKHKLYVPHHIIRSLTTDATAHLRVGTHMNDVFIKKKGRVGELQYWSLFYLPKCREEDGSPLRTENELRRQGWLGSSLRSAGRETHVRQMSPQMRRGGEQNLPQIGILPHAPGLLTQDRTVLIVWDAAVPPIPRTGGSVLLATTTTTTITTHSDAPDTTILPDEATTDVYCLIILTSKDIPNQVFNAPPQ